MKSAIRTDFLVAAGLAVAVGLLGLWPHLAFISDVGELRYMHYAYDEDTYTLGWLNGALRSTRLLSGFALSLVHSIAAASLNLTMIASDFIFPAIATLAAYFAASQIVSSRPVRAFAALALVFASDLFSLGNLAVWNFSSLNISRFTDIVGRFGANLVPPYETSFLSIYRTPEPQVSLTLAFILLGLLTKLANGQTSRSALVATVVAISLLPLGYTFVTFPLALIAGGSLIVFLSFRMTASAAAIILGFCGAIAVYALAAYWQQDGSQSTTGVAAALSYHTRLPIITPATLASAGFSAIFATWLLAARRWSPLALLALGCLVTPFVLGNQQILTNIMISARDWERNVSYQLLVFGGAAAASIVPASSRWRTPLVAPMATALIFAVAIRGQIRTYDMWLAHNETSIAMARALKSIDQKELAETPLILESVSMAPLLQLRSETKLNIPLSFYRAGIDLIPNMAPGATSAPPSPLEPAVFEQWATLGISPEKVEQIVRSEIKQRAGTYISFLFSFRDSWYPSSDNRAVRSAELERSVSSLINRYRDYLREHKNRGGGLLLMSRPLEPDPIAVERIGGASAYLYSQQGIGSK